MKKINLKSNKEETFFKKTYRINELYSITDRKDWIGFSGLLIGTVFLIIWAVWGTINTKVIGQGMLLKSAGIKMVTSNTQGKIESFKTGVGSEIKAGGVIAIISQKEMEYKMEDLKVEMENLKKKNNERQEVRNIYEANLLVRVNDLSNQIKLLEKIPGRNLSEEKSLIDVKQSLSETQNALEKITVETLEDYQVLRAMEREFEIVKRKYEHDSKIISPYNGIVIDIFNAPGDIVRPGQEVLFIEQAGAESGELEAVVFFPAIDGKKIKLNSILKVNLSNIETKQYGYIISRVKYVSPYPTTFKGMMRVLQNENVVNEILKSGPRVEVIGKLVKDESTYSGYAWTSLRGPRIKLQTGTFCQGEIAIESATPFELIFPK